jgi:hypothetical protein
MIISAPNLKHRKSLGYALTENWLELGSARASRAVFRALAENHERTGGCQNFANVDRKRTGREARPATPEAGVLPKSRFRLNSASTTNAEMLTCARQKISANG